MTGPTIMFLVLITVATSLDVLADSSCVDEGNCEAETSLCDQAISVFRKDDVFARKEMEKCVEKINGGDHNGAGLLDIQKGIFRLLGGSAYRVFRISYAADFHKHERAEDYPYLLSNYVKFVRVVMNVYKGLKVIPESEHKSLDELVRQTRLTPPMHTCMNRDFPSTRTQWAVAFAASPQQPHPSP